MFTSVSYAQAASYVYKYIKFIRHRVVNKPNLYESSLYESQNVNTDVKTFPLLIYTVELQWLEH